MMIDEVVAVRLDWRTVCAVACRALCLGVSFDDVCNMAIKAQTDDVLELDSDD